MFRKRGRTKNTHKTSTLKDFQIVPEPFDLCLKYNVVSAEQHKIGLRFRWLHTLHFGLSTVQGYNIAKIRGRDVSKHDEKWLEKRRNEYKLIASELHRENRKAARILYNIIIYHYYPSFLRYRVHKEILIKLQKFSSKIPNIAPKIESDIKIQEIEVFKAGIEILEEIYSRKNRDSRIEIPELRFLHTKQYKSYQHVKH